MPRFPNWDGIEGTDELRQPHTQDEHFKLDPTADDWHCLIREYLCMQEVVKPIVDAGAMVASVFGRAGVVVAQAGDYNGTQITITPSGSITATNVGAALNQLDTNKISTTGSLPVGQIWVGNVSNSPMPRTMSGDATISQTGALTLASVMTPGTLIGRNTDFTFDAKGRLIAATPSAAGGVTSVFGRTGVVTAQAGDYNAGQITVTPAGNITATDVQAALGQLDGFISTNAGGIATNAGDIGTNAGNIGTNAAGIATNAGDIATNAAAIAANSGSISTNASNIGSLTTIVAGNTGDIASNASDIASNTSAILTNVTGISTNAGDIAVLQAEQLLQNENIDELKGAGCEPDNLFPNGTRQCYNALYPIDPSGGFVLDATASPHAPSSIRRASTGNVTLINFFENGIKIPVSSFSESEYAQEVEIKMENYVGAASGVRVYTGFTFLDHLNRTIQWWRSQYRETSLTTLTAPLNPGDTTVQVADASGWIINTLGYAAPTSYVDETGYNWGPRGYTRLGDNKGVTNIVGNTITLTAAWAGPAAVVGQTIRQAAPDGGTYRYIGWDGDAASNSIVNDGDAWRANTGYLRKSTEFRSSELTDGKSILSGAAWMAPILLFRPIDVTASYDILIGSWKLNKLAKDTTAPRAWSVQQPGARIYLQEAQTTDEGMNTTYGYSNQNWSSNYSRTSPTRTAPGIIADTKATLKHVKMWYRKSNTQDIQFNVRLWKQSKVANSAAVTNTLLETKFFAPGANNNNQFLDFTAGYAVEENDVLFMTFEKTNTDGNAQTFLYMQSLSWFFEEDC